MNYIKSINWISTYQCNLRCTHCDIWKNPNTQHLSKEAMRSIFDSEIIQKSYHYHGTFFDVAISGGEPLLLKNLYELIDVIEEKTPGALHSISTNGTLEKKLLELLIYLKKKGKNLRKINISIDGSEAIHDSQRGVQGSFRKSIQTIQKVKKVFPKQSIEIKLTITKKNIQDIFFLSKLAEKLGVFFSFKPVENMTHYTNQKYENTDIFEESDIEKIENQITQNPFIEKQNQHIDPSFFRLIPEYLRSGLGERKKLCSVAEESITIMPDGKIFSCILMEQIGDLQKTSIDDIWNGQARESQKNTIKEGKCPECMLMCGAFKTRDMYA